MSPQTQIPFETLADLVDGRLSESEATKVRKQLAHADPRTQADLAWLQALAAFRRTMPLEAPPEQVAAASREALRTHFRRWTEERRQPSLFQRLVAQLTFDSRLQPALVGVRGEPTGPGQLLYTTDQMDIELHLLPAGPGQVRILGQALPRDPDTDMTDCAVQLLAGEQEIGLTSTNELGEFTFETARDSDYTVILVTEEGEIALEHVDLTAG
jgi:hypothetical protein